MRYIYMVHIGSKCRLFTNLRDVAACMKANPGSLRRRLSYGYYKDCGSVMDYPTFYAVSEQF